MDKRITYFLLLLLPFSVLKAQDKDESQIISDFLRWKQNNQWDSVIAFSNNHETGSIESFYVQNIIGEAFFRSNNYRKAAVYLEYAVKFNSSDAGNKLMLYQSYRFSGNEIMTKYQASKLNKYQKKENRISHFRLIEKIYLETGICFSNNIEKNGTREFVVENPVTITNNQFSLLDNYRYTHGGLQISLGPSVSLFTSYHRFNIDEKIHQIIIPGTTYKEHYFTSVETDYFATTNIRVGKTWSIHPAWHNIRFITKREILQNGVPSMVDSLIPSRMAGITLVKNSLYSNHRWGIAFSEINFVRQIHWNYEYWHYPQGNLNFYTAWRLAFTGETKRIAPNLRFTMGGKLSHYLWAEGFACLGNLKNSNEQNGYILYNFSDNSHFNGGLNLIFPVGKHFEIRLMYQYWLKSLSYDIETRKRISGQTNQKSTSYFDNHNLTGSILWKL